MSYRQERSYENLNKWQFDGVGEYGIPAIAPEIPGYCMGTDNFISFNYAKTCNKDHESKGVHFFIDDYQFERLWKRPDDYIDMLSKFRLVFAPDFSMYTDWPKAMQIYNHYRKHWLAAFWQANGISVVPTICWSDKDSFNWCFDGEPVGSVVAVSSMGTQVNKESQALFLQGYNEMLQRLQPELIYFYGSIPDGIDQSKIISLTPLYKQVRERCGDIRE